MLLLLLPFGNAQCCPGSFKMPAMAIALVNNSLNVRARSLNFLIAKKEPMILVNNMSPYIFENVGKSEKQANAYVN